MKQVILLAILILSSYKVFSQNKMDDYEQSYYVTFSGTHPGQIIKKGNNWDILAAFKESGKLSKLDERKINYSQKQIDILCALNFLQKTNDSYQTLITILDQKDTKGIRTFTKDIASSINKLIKNDFLILSKRLNNKGFENNTYSVFFSFLMDNIVWKLFENNRILPEKKITVETPIWDGTIWFDYPKRNFSCGTNSEIINNLVFATNWTDSCDLSFVELDKSKILNEIIANSRIKDDGLKNQLFTYNICDKDGNITIPLITKKESKEIYNISDSIANTIYNYIVNEIDFSKICTKYHIKSKGDAIIIVYHDIMYDILDILENDGFLKKPNAFTNPKTAMKGDLKDLVLIYEE